MTKWVIKGLGTGLKSTRYPASPEQAAGVSPGRPSGTRLAGDESAAGLIDLCPTAALESDENGVSVRQDRCVHCMRCTGADGPTVVRWEQGYEWAAIDRTVEDAQRRLGRAFGRSLHIRFLDAGACGACMSEARQLNNPYYNIHRLGFFMTPTPRNADILLIAGPSPTPCGFRCKKPTMPCPRPSGSSRSAPARFRAACSDRASRRPPESASFCPSMWPSRVVRRRRSLSCTASS